MAGTISSEKIDLLVYGPMRPILENGFPDQFVVHSAETRADLERLTADTIGKMRGMAVTYHTVVANKESLARFPVLGWHLRRGGHLFVDRRHPDPTGILEDRTATLDRLADEVGSSMVQQRERLLDLCEEIQIGRAHV